MGRSISTLTWMGALSAVTLLLGIAREVVIARDLQASGQADLFFRGVIVLSAARGFTLSLLRARWIPVPAGVSARALLRADGRALGWIALVAVLALLVFVRRESWTDPAIVPMVGGVLLSVAGGAVRALAERAGLERRGFALDWAAPLGAILGALAIGRGALGPTTGLFAGLLVGALVLLPVIWAEPAHAEPVELASRSLRALLVDAVLYVNLGLLDAGLSATVFAEGEFALLNYAYLFVNAVLAVPTAGATVVALRLAAHGAASHERVRRWALLGSVVVGVGVVAIGLGLQLAPIAAVVDGAAGWSVSERVAPLVLWTAPFGALRLLNTVGRQWVVATEPARLLVWDGFGIGLRTIVLVVGASVWGPVASPIALVVAELLQVPAWWRRR